MPGFEGIEANSPAPPPGLAGMSEKTPPDDELDCPAASECKHGCEAECHLQQMANAEYLARQAPIRPASIASATEGVRRGLLNPPIVSRFRVYVAGPIDFRRSGSMWMADRDELIYRLRESGFEVFAPHEGATQYSETVDHEQAAEAALTQADAVVAYLPSGVVTYGTPIEIYRARTELKIPVMVVGCSEKPKEGSHGGSVAINRLGVEYLVEPSDAFFWCTGLRDRQQRSNVQIDTSLLYDGAINATIVANSPVDQQGREHLPFVMDGGMWALPKRHYDDDAGLDLFVTESVTIRPGEFVDVPAGCRTALPRGTFGLIVGRSSTVRKRGILVVPGVIDVGWRGPLFAGAYNAGSQTQTIQHGDRIGQLLILPNLTAQFVPVQARELPPHERGENGFGSTGGVTFYEEGTA